MEKRQECENPWRLFENGAEGIRTPDLLNAIQTRSQLRHSPELCLLCSSIAIRNRLFNPFDRCLRRASSLQLSVVASSRRRQGGWAGASNESPVHRAVHASGTRPKRARHPSAA
jgi:hypothetical protein